MGLAAGLGPLTGCGGSDRPAAFCREAAAAARQFRDLSPQAFTDPKAIARVLRRMEAIARVAPKAVRPDTDVIVRGLRELEVFVRSGGTEPKRSTFDFAAFQRAFERLHGVEQEVC